jgi:cyclophilin family peptidyl-prolyl cis-trans isomerase
LSDRVPTRCYPPLMHIALDTTHGTIVLDLDEAKAPISVANFAAYVESGHYDGTIFHRVISNFMIQGGGFTPDMKQKATRANIKNEWKNGLKNAKYTIAMARTQVADSASSQFFINVADNAFLSEPRDGAGYAVFGKVVAGTDVVEKIKAVPTKSHAGHENVPATPVVINKARRLSPEEAAKLPG